MTTAMEPQAAKSHYKYVRNSSSSARRAISNWFELSLISLLPGFLFCGHVSQTSAQASQTKAGSAARMVLASNDIYLSKGPYAIVVPKGTHHNEEFSLLVENAPPLVLIVKPCKDEAAKEIGANLTIGSDFFMSCKYAPAKDHRAKVREFAIGNNREYFCDLNADGKWDVRVLVDYDRDHIQAKSEIWYRGEWRDTTNGDQPGPYSKKLQAGPNVWFDMKNGLWLPKEGMGGKAEEKEGSLEEDKWAEDKRTASSTARIENGDAAQTSWQVPQRTKTDPAIETLLASKDVYVSKHPYTILVPKGLRRYGEFSLLVEDAPPLILSVNPSHDEAGKQIGAQRELLFSIGSDLTMSCKYVAAEGLKAKVREFAVSIDGDCLIDLNADGKWDTRILGNYDRDHSKPRVQIWYQGKWRDTTDGDRAGQSVKKLQGGPAVSFDMKTGLWVPREMSAGKKKIP